MLYLYSLPNYVMGVVIIGITVGLSLAGYVLFHRLVKTELSDEHKGLAMSVLGVVATVNSLLLAFSAVSVWESYGNADEAVMAEANTIGALGRDLAVFESPGAVKALALLRQYTEMVIAEEWPLMQKGEASAETEELFDDTFAAISQLELDTTRRETMMYEVFLRTNELMQHRHTRLYTARSQVPGTLWAVVLIGTVLCMVTTYVLPASKFHALMIAALALSIGLVFYFIIAMDRPFAGKESISSDPFKDEVQSMIEWQARAAARSSQAPAPAPAK